MTTNSTRLVSNYTNYTLVVGYSPRAQQDLFQVINNKWGVIAFETPSEEQAVEVCKLLDELYGKESEDINKAVEVNLGKAH